LGENNNKQNPSFSAALKETIGCDILYGGKESEYCEKNILGTALAIVRDQIFG
jgi:hypothetical protein